jgi:hypothetical protein
MDNAPRKRIGIRAIASLKIPAAFPFTLASIVDKIEV